MSRRLSWPAAILAAAVIGLLGSLLIPYRAFPGDGVNLEIAPGASAAGVAAGLADHGLIRSPALFRGLVRLSGTSTRLQAGEYRFEGASSTFQVLDKLVKGQVVLHRVTIPEGLRIQEIVDLLVGAGLGDERALLEAAGDPRVILDLDPQAIDLEGYLFPDTYQFPRGTEAYEIVGRMAGRFREVFGEGHMSRAAELGLSVREVVTLASLVEKEAGLAEERPLVSSVFHNRLARRMLLQCDPTVIYGLTRLGLYDGRLTRAGLQFDSPYNTYLHPGLPPGPIASPGAESIEATLHPAESEYLYFVSRNDGSHQFSTRLEEHTKAVRRYQR